MKHSKTYLFPSRESKSRMLWNHLCRESSIASRLAFVFIATIATSAFAADTTWTGGDGDWSDETKWSAGVPDSTKSAAFSSTGGTISMGGEIRYMKSMDSMNNSNPVVWTADEGGGLTVPAGGDFCIGRVGAGTLVFQSGTYDIAGALRPGWYKRSWAANDLPATGKVEVVSANLKATNVYIGTDGGCGIMEVSGGKLETGEVSVGRNFHSEVPQKALSKLVVTGGEVTLGALTVGYQADGYMEIANCEIAPGSFVMGNNADISGEVVVNTNAVIHNKANDINVGSSGIGTITVKNGGSVYTKYWLKLCAADGNAYTCTVNLEDGGVYSGGAIGKGNSPDGKAILNFNGGIIRQEADANAYQTLIMDNNGGIDEVNVLSKGAIIDTSLRNNDVYGNFEGEGFLEKRGSYTLWVKNAVDLKRGIRVVEGTLTLEGGFATETTATTPIKEIHVASGASLDLKGNIAETPTIYVERFTQDGEEKGAGAYSACNATIIVIENASEVATATWTGDAGDGDLTNSDNWLCYNSDGVLIYDAVPTATTVITVPYDGASLVEYRAIKAAYPSATCVLDVAGDQKLDIAPDIAFEALGWYDAADEDTVTLNDAGQMTLVANKGTAGASLDLGQSIELGNHEAAYGTSDSFLQNGRNVFAFTNSYGLISASAAGIAADSGRTLLVMSKPVFNAYMNNQGTGYYAQMFHMGLEYGAWNGTAAFRIEDWGGGDCRLTFGTNSTGVTETCLYSVDGYNSNSDYGIWNFGTDTAGNITLAYCGPDGIVANVASIASEALGPTENSKVCLGGRFGNHATSAGNITEAFVFDKALTSAELATMRAYLQVKWFGADGVSAFMPGDISLSDGATLDLDGYSVSLDSVSGSGTIANGTVTAISTLDVEIDSTGTATCVTLPEGTELAGSITVRVTGLGNLASDGIVALKAATGDISVAGSVELVSGDSADAMEYRAKIVDGALQIFKRMGTMILIAHCD